MDICIDFCYCVHENKMNIIEKDIILHLTKASFTNQRILSEKTGYSLGKVNQSLRSLQEQGYLSAEMSLTAKAFELLESHRPQRAIILAAGYGMRIRGVGDGLLN